MKALVLAAGLGTRLKPFTDSHPKALFPIQGICLLERVIQRLKTAGVTEILINVCHKAEQILDFLERKNNFDVPIRIADERELLLNTGGAIRHACSVFKEAFVVHNVDILSNIDVRQLYEDHLRSKVLVSLAVGKPRCGENLLLSDKSLLLCGAWFHERGEGRMFYYVKDFVAWSFCGVHVVDPSIASWVTEGLCFPVFDLYFRLAYERCVWCWDVGEALWSDSGTTQGVSHAESIVALL